ncbi:MAG: DUF29 domain-containing protein, partial [bacterium]
LGDGNFEEAKNGIEELIEALSRSEKRALKSQLVRLMVHVLKWKTQPEKRSRSWIATIYGAREEIADIQEETPSLTNAVIEGLWDKCFRVAKREAEAEMNQKSALSELSWQEVFEESYDG